MAVVYAVCNQKGGVAKTLTSVSLGIGLAREGKKALLVDIDPQGSLDSKPWLSAAGSDGDNTGGCAGRDYSG